MPEGHSPAQKATGRLRPGAALPHNLENVE